MLAISGERRRAVGRKLECGLGLAPSGFQAERGRRAFQLDRVTLRLKGDIGEATADNTHLARGNVSSVVSHPAL